MCNYSSYDDILQLSQPNSLNQLSVVKYNTDETSSMERTHMLS